MLRNNAPHGNPLGIDPAKPRRDDGIAVLYIRIAWNVYHLRHIGVIHRPRDDTRHTRFCPLNQRPDGGTYIEDKLHFRRERSNLRHTSYEPLSRNDRHILAHPILRAAVHNDRTCPECGVTSDHTRSKEIELLHRLLVRQQFPQAGILRRILLCHRILLTQLLDLVFEPLILLVHRCDLPEIRRHILNLLPHIREHHFKRSEHSAHRTRRRSGLKTPARSKENNAEQGEQNEEERPDLAS